MYAASYGLGASAVASSEGGILSQIQAKIAEFVSIPSRLAAVNATATAIANKPGVNPLAKAAAQRVQSRTPGILGAFKSVFSSIKFQTTDSSLANPVLIVIGIVAAIAAVTVLAGIVAVIEKTKAEEQIVKGLADGTLTKDDIAALEKHQAANKVPSIFDQATGLIKWALAAAAIVVGYKAYRAA